MKRLILSLLCLSFSLTPARSQGWFPLVKPAAVGYQGPVDVKPSATAYWGLDAATAAYANGTNLLADLVASTGGAAVCTLRVATTGFADVSGSYCAGTTPPLACAAASGGSCKIAKLYDQVGTNHMVQATSANQPAITFNAQGSLPGMTFSGGQVLVATNNVTLAEPFSVSYIAKRTAFPANFSDVMSSGTGGAVQVGFDSTSGNAFVFAGTVQAAPAVENAFHAVQSAFASGGAGSTIYVDGVSSAINPGTAGFNGKAPTIGGADSTPTNPLTGVVLRVGLWPVQFSGSENSNLNSNAHTNWGF